MLWATEIRPEGWGEIWRDPGVSGVVSVAVAPATSRGPLEIGVLDSSRHLRRYAADGSPLGEATLEEEGWGLQGADLDGDGEKEWLVRGQYSTLTVLDSRGQAYWTHYGTEGLRRGDQPREDSFQVGGVADLDGDGFQEIIVRSGDSVTALRSLGQVQWVHRSKQPLRHLMVDAHGVIWGQSDRGLFTIDALGRAGTPVAPPIGRLRFQGETVGRTEEHLRIFASRYQFVDADHDLDADGRKDVVLAGRGGVSAYDGDGKTILSLSISETQRDPRFALADLDGRPGDEMVLFIPHYGLVALGRRPGTEARLAGPGKGSHP